MRGRWTLAAVIAATALLSLALPAAAQSGDGYYAQTCRTVRGRIVCSNTYRSGGGAGSHAYDRWNDGSPALGSSVTPDSYRFPQYLGGHNSWYGFGR